MSLSKLLILFTILIGLRAPSLSAAAQVDLPAAPNCAAVPRPAAAPGDTLVETLTVDGVERAYRLYVPTRYDPAAPTALVFSIHGFASNAAQQQGFSAWDEIAEREGFVVAYPQGAGFPARWNSGPLFVEGFAQEDDVAFVRALADHLTTTLCIDPARVYATGLSNGAGMSNRLACEASDLIAAIGGVAGAYSPIDCTPDRPVPVIAFHGTDDPIVPIDGLESSPGGGALPPVAQWVEGWAARNGCDIDAPAALEPVGAVTGTAYADCDSDAAVVYYVIEAGGHTWPGGGPQPIFITGPVNDDIDASELMWAFFQQHPLRLPPGT